MRLFKSLSIVASIVCLASCSTPKDITYLQNLNYGQTTTVAPTKAITAQPDDRLSIVVHSKDPQLVQQFNLPVANYRLGTTNTSATNNNNGNVSPFVVDSFGDIDYPIIGTIHVGGLTRQQIEKQIKDALIQRNLVKDPVVIVQFLDHAITVLGEVGSPGRKTFDRDHLTIFEGIGLAGDLKIDGLRTNVRVLRLENGEEKAYEIDLTDARSVYQSPAYYLQQNDVVYVEPNDKAKRNTTVNGNAMLTPQFWISLASFAVTVALIFIK